MKCGGFRMKLRKPALKKNSLSKLPVKLSFLEAFFCFFYPIFSLYYLKDLFYWTILTEPFQGSRACFGGSSLNIIAII